MSFLVENSPYICHNSMPEELGTSWVIAQGEVSWKLTPAFSQTLPHAPFPFVACNTSQL